MSKNIIPLESIIILHNNLAGLSARSPEKRRLQEEAAKGFDVSLSTVRRAVRTYIVFPEPINRPLILKTL